MESSTTSVEVVGGAPALSTQPLSEGWVSQLSPKVGGPAFGLLSGSPFLSRMARSALDLALDLVDAVDGFDVGDDVGR